MKMKFEITPIALGRPRINTKNLGRYLPARSQEFKKELGILAKASYRGEPLSKPLKVILRFYKPVKETSRRYGDTDNLAKAVLDACNGILWVDDSQIIELHAYKYKGAGKIEMEVLEY